jgi:hypothetical protein
MKARRLSLAIALLLLSGCSQGGGEPGTLLKLYAHAKAKLSNGRTEIRRSLDAKKTAHSYRMKIALTMHPGSALTTDVEVSCPDRERIVTQVGDTKMETVRIGAEGYIKQNDRQWVKQAITPDAYPCGASPGAPSPWAMMNEGRDMSTILAGMAGNDKAPITVNPGALVQVGGDRCQQWILSFEHPGGKLPSGGRGMVYTLCLGSSDHLPRQLVMGSGGMVVTYSDWNKPIEIAAPADARLAAAAPPK